MRTLSAQLDLAAFFERAARAPLRVLMLDYDGTLAPFQVRPERALPYPGVEEVLDGIMAAASSRVVIVSGRPVEDLVPLSLVHAVQHVVPAHTDLAVDAVGDGCSRLGVDDLVLHMGDREPE